MKKLLIIVLAISMFLLPSCSKNDAIKIANGIELNIDENTTIKDIEKQLEKFGYINIHKEWTNDDGDIILLYDWYGTAKSQDIGYVAEGYYFPKDFYSYDSGSHMSVVYTVSYETVPFEELGTEKKIYKIEEIPVEIFISREKNISFYKDFYETGEIVSIEINIQQSDRTILQINASVYSTQENHRLQTQETK